MHTLPSAPVEATAKSVEAAHFQILKYIESEASCTLRLVLSETVLQSREIFTILPKIADRGYYISYCRVSTVLSIIPRPTGVHDVIAPFVHYSIKKWLESGFLTPEEWSYIQFMPPSNKKHQGWVSRKSRKRLSWKKESDCGVGFGLPPDRIITRVVIEVGFSEPYEDLVDDIRGWLQRSSKLSIAILINIKEDSRALNSLQASEGFYDRASTLLSRYGNSLGQEENGIDMQEPFDDNESDESMYDNIDANIIDTDWVGPLSASVEIWSRTTDGSPNRREGPIVGLLPPCIN